MKRKFGQLLTAASLTLTGVTHVHADTTDVEHILSELNRQQTSASSLIKAAREPASLAATSILNAPKKSELKKDENVLTQLTAIASTTVSKFKQTGLASWYGRQFHGKKTASGERFDMNALTAAHPSLPMNCYVKVTNKDNGKSVVVRINDRPLQSNRMLDLSYGAAKALGMAQKSTSNVVIERIDK